MATSRQRPKSARYPKVRQAAQQASDRVPDLDIHIAAHRTTSGRSGRWRRPSGPGEAGQDKPVPVRVRDRDAQAIPVRIAGRDPSATRINQAADNILVDFTIDVENQQILLGWRGRCCIFRVADKFEMPGGIWPSDDQQRTSAFCGGIGPEQDVEAQAVDPEPLGCLQVVTWTSDTQVARRQRFHCPIIA